MHFAWLRRLQFVGWCLILSATACGAPENEDTGSDKYGDAFGGYYGIGGYNAFGGDYATGGYFASGGTYPTGGAPTTGGVSGLGATGGIGDLGIGGYLGMGGSGIGGYVSLGGSGIGGYGVGGSGMGGDVGLGGSGTGGYGVGGSGMGGSGIGGYVSTGGSGTGGSGTGGYGVGGSGTGGSGTGGSDGDSCGFTVNTSTSSAIPTVGIVEWSTDLGDVSSAEIVYTLDNAGTNVLNVGGVAPADVTNSPYRTLLLGLKGQSTYTFHIEATLGDGSVCESEDYTLTTGSTGGAPQVTRSASNPSAQAVGFIVTSGGNMSNGPAFIVDADGAVVWWAPAPTDCGRARLDYEGQKMWMETLNAMNQSGEVRWVSMDGLNGENNVSGLGSAHHDFTVLPGGIVAVLCWSGSGSDPESDLIERSPDGTLRTAFRIGSSVYPGGQSVLGGGSNTYHSNAIQYYASDDTYTIGDRNPMLIVKVTRSGQPVWQFGGDCSRSAAPACASGSWDTNHGHHLLPNGTFLMFSNGAFMSSTPSQAIEFSLNASGSSLTANQVRSYTSSSGAHSDSLGDVQRLPNGNTLVTFSNNGRIEELDPSWNVVQTLTATSFGYANWRETLYGPPAR